MAITRVQQGNETTTTTVTPASNTTVGNTLIAAAFYSGGAGITVTFSDTATVPNAWTTHVQQGNGQAAGGYVAIGSARIASQVTNSMNIKVTFGGATPSFVAMWFGEYSGLAASGWFDAANSGTSGATGTTSASSGLVTPAGSGELLIGACAATTTGLTFTPGTGWTQLWSTSWATATKSLALNEYNAAPSGAIADANTLSSSAVWTDAIGAFTSVGGAVVPTHPHVDVSITL